MGFRCTNKTLLEYCSAGKFLVVVCRQDSVCFNTHVVVAGVSASSMGS